MSLCGRCQFLTSLKKNITWWSLFLKFIDAGKLLWQKMKVQSCHAVSLPKDKKAFDLPITINTGLNFELFDDSSVMRCVSIWSSDKHCFFAQSIFKSPHLKKTYCDRLRGPCVLIWKVFMRTIIIWEKNNLELNCIDDNVKSVTLCVKPR